MLIISMSSLSPAGMEPERMQAAARSKPSHHDQGWQLYKSRSRESYDSSHDSRETFSQDEMVRD